MQKIFLSISLYFISHFIFAQNHYDSAFIKLENMLKNKGQLDTAKANQYIYFWLMFAKVI